MICNVVYWKHEIILSFLRKKCKVEHDDSSSESAANKIKNKRKQSRKNRDLKVCTCTTHGKGNADYFTT